MPASRPEEVNYLISDALSRGDLDAAMALYEPGASFVPQPGQVATGQALREAIAGFIALKPALHIEITSMTQADDLAITSSKWSLEGTAPDGSALKMSGRGTELVRRQPDGTWRFVIDNPYSGEEG